MTSIPLFPLGTVLFPGGVLPLRIFETRYMDMVRDCMRTEQPFGVVLITAGKEVGEAAQHEAVGTLARIVDFDMQQLGLLLIRTVGGQRFRITDRHVDAGKLAHAQIELIAPDAALAVPQELMPAVDLLRTVAAQFEEQQPEIDKRLILAPYQFDDCAWVANRLCEVLPIPAATKFKMMALEDPLSRLRLVLHYLQQQKVVS